MNATWMNIAGKILALFMSLPLTLLLVGKPFVLEVIVVWLGSIAGAAVLMAWYSREWDSLLRFSLYTACLTFIFAGTGIVATGFGSDWSKVIRGGTYIAIALTLRQALLKKTADD